MKQSRITFAFVFLVILIGEKVEGDDCKEYLKKQLMDNMIHVVPCMDQLGLKTPEDKRDKVLCVLRCVLQKAKLLGGDGGIDIDMLNQFFDGIPPSFRDKAVQVATECSSFAADLKPNEPKCESYGPLLNCATDLIPKIC